MSKIQLDNVESGYNLSKINSNFQKIANELNNRVLYRDNPFGEPNAMLKTLDMNGKNIINVGNIYNDNQPPGSIDADDVIFTPFATISSTNVQEAIEELYSEATGGVGGVTSFNTRTGAVTLLESDVLNALGFTPANATVNNVVALRNISILETRPQTTKGYYLVGDGGAATYYLDASDTTSLDDGGSVIVTTAGARWKIARGTIYSALQFGARGDSKYGVAGSNDTLSLQRFINYLMKTGTKGYIPAGRYRCTTQLNIPENCYLFGDGWKDVRDMTPENGPNTRDWTKSKVVGTIIYADFMNSVAPSQIYVTGNSVTIKDMEFETNQPAPSATSWTPNPVPIGIYAFRDNYYEQGGNSLTVDNVMLRNHNNGIKLFGVARGYLNNIFGQVFGTGIDVSKNGDVLRMNDIHLNWSFFSGLLATNNYMDLNSQGILLGRVDNPILTNYFIFGGLIGIHLYVDTSLPNGGSTFRLQASNIGLDNIAIGVRLDDACSLSLSNFYVFNRSNVSESRGIHSVQVLGGGYTPCRINLVNGDFQGSQAEAIRLETPGSANLANVQITDYNNSGGAFPGIAAYSGVAIQYANLSNTTLSTTPLTQAFGTGTISGGAGGGGGGVTSFNTRTGVVSLLQSDISAANGAVRTGGNAFTGVQSSTGTIQVTGATLPASGAGAEISYSGGAFYSGYNRSTLAYTDVTMAGATLNFQINGAIQAAIDPSGYFLMGYSSSQGSYKLQVNNDALIGGALTLGTVPTATTGNRAATCDYVINKIAAAGVTSYNGRTGVVTGISTDVTGALGYTPASTGANTFSGVQSSTGTIRSTGGTLPASGAGIELTYTTGGFLTSYNRTSSTYLDQSYAAASHTFQISGTARMALDVNGSLLIGYGTTNGSTYKLQVNSQIYATNATIATSDKRVKKDIKPLEEGLEVVKALKPVTFNFIEHDVHNFSKDNQVGFIAQDIEEVLKLAEYAKSVVATNEDGKENLKGVAETKLIPFIIKALQELAEKVEKLENK